MTFAKFLLVKRVLNTLLGKKTIKKKVRSLYIMLPKLSAYRKDFNEIKCMSFLIKNDELLGKYN